MKLLYLLVGVAFLVFQTQAQDGAVAQDESEAQDLDEMEEEAEDEFVEAEDVAGMGSPELARKDRPRCRKGLFCRPKCGRKEHVIGTCPKGLICCRIL
ncbi:alpha-defensin 15-like [Alligator sinensis]|uniref:Beta-defensin n=1 Tax=Alligator sinensis TaxID=38654 RepID=A0A3Q0HHQ1_ALLSI|nr:alpha-defensin 15-like [Alligator sinensis]